MATAAELIDLATGLLEDPGNDYWSRSELLSYLNDGLKFLATKRPDQFVDTMVLTLIDGVKQTLPAGTVGIVRVIGNIDSTETVRGRSIRMIDKWLLDAGSPNWMNAAVGETRQLALSPDPSTEFWVSPPAALGTKIEVQAEKDPTVAAQGTTLEVAAKFHPALVDYMVYRALSKDAEYAVEGKAARFYQSFLAVVAPPQVNEPS